MPWQYRLVRTKYYNNEGFSIHMVYVDREGNIKSWIREPATVQGSSLEEITEELNNYRETLNKRIIGYGELTWRRLHKGYTNFNVGILYSTSQFVGGKEVESERAV